MLAVAERFDLDRRAISRMQRLRSKYPAGPLLLRIPGRTTAVILHPQDVHRILAESPEPFATASLEKRAALAHFEPKNFLISHGEDRADRRRYNEEVLEAHHPVHHLAENFIEVVNSEVDFLDKSLPHRAELSWHDFSDTWFRIVRRIVFGDAAGEDHELSELMAKLRSAANWAFLWPQRKGLREQLLHRIGNYLRRAEPYSLAGVMAHTQTTSRTEPVYQVPQWLFAFDPAGMTTFRSLALLVSHSEHVNRAQQEIRSRRGQERQYMPYLRAAVLESLRLWPTTPLLLRESTVATNWETGVLRANTSILIFTPFFQRDNERLPYADRFSPELWMTEQAAENWPLIPFSEGPAVCPGRHLVLLLSTAVIAALLENRGMQLKAPTRLAAGQLLPATLNHYALRFELSD